MSDPALQISSPEQARLKVARGWRLALPMLAATLLAILVLYRETAMAMVEIWARSETYTHGFLVPPITLWLIWRIRHDLARLTPRPCVWALLALAVAGFVWLLAELATVGVLAQFSLTTLLVLAVPAVLGVPVARRIAFPLAFLYFAVPFGEFALPQLMEWTANFTVLGLRLSGIPVFREGLNFVIPTGSWSVVEACSGVRYLIASLSIGTLFAYLNYHSLKRRLIFIAVSFVVPVIANWIRAYLIVLVGHLSGNTLAVGVDHLIYGWVFFGMVIMTMFWIGARWRDDGLHPVRQIPIATPAVATSHSLVISAFSVIVLAAIWPLAQWQIGRSLPPQVREIEALGPIAGWPAILKHSPEHSPEPFSGWNPGFGNTFAAWRSTFSSEQRLVGLYLAYYRNQDERHKMVTSANALVASGDRAWTQVSGGLRKTSLDRQSIVLRTAELRSADSQGMVAWQWYWVNGRLTSSDYMAKAYTAFFRLTGQGDDSAVIVVYSPKEGGGEAALEDFVNAAGEQIESALRRTRERR
jgi:exosortase A